MTDDRDVLAELRATLGRAMLAQITAGIGAVRAADVGQHAWLPAQLRESLRRQREMITASLTAGVVPPRFPHEPDSYPQ